MPIQDSGYSIPQDIGLQKYTDIKDDMKEQVEEIIDNNFSADTMQSVDRLMRDFQDILGIRTQLASAGGVEAHDQLPPASLKNGMDLSKAASCIINSDPEVAAMANLIGTSSYFQKDLEPQGFKPAPTAAQILAFLGTKI
jgi:hypothetical protein